MKASRAHGFSNAIVREFKEGIPPHWKQLLLDEVKRVWRVILS